MILIQMADRDSCFRLYYGPELVSAVVQSWLKKQPVDTHYITPGSPSPCVRVVVVFIFLVIVGQGAASE